MTAADTQAIVKRERSIAMLADPQSWPLWPFLPMKRHVDDMPFSGFAVTADFPTVVLKQFPTTKGILLQLACEHPEGLPVPGGGHQKADENARRMYEEHVEARYDDVEAMLDAGWEID
jgi:hypothetical protein